MLMNSNQYTNKETSETVSAFQWFSGHTGKISDPPDAEPNVKIMLCKKCGHFYMDHGYVEGLGFICPGDWMIFNSEDMEILKPKDFEKKYEPARKVA